MTHGKNSKQLILSFKLWGEVMALVYWGDHKGLLCSINSEMCQPATLRKRKWSGQELTSSELGLTSFFCFNIIILWDEMNGWEKDIYERTITEIVQEHVSLNFECSAGHVKIKWIHDMAPLWKQPNAPWMSFYQYHHPVAESIRSFKGLEHSYF